MTKLKVVIVFICSLLLLTACGTKETPSMETPTETPSMEAPTETPSMEALTDKSVEFAEKQLAAPKKEEVTAEIVVKDFGTMYFKFFQDEAPKAVENFLTHAKEGYYDGLSFHRVMNDFMIQGGDPTGTGMGGESIWNSAFEDEFTDTLHPYRGALCMANSGPNTNGSQFFIVQASMTEESMEQLNIAYKLGFSEKLMQSYVTNGGTPWLHNAHTVFGQLYDGYDVLDAIASTKTNESDAPAKPVLIEKIIVNEP